MRTMEVFRGKGIYEKIAMGEVFLYQKENIRMERYEVSDTHLEWNRFEQARQSAKKQLQELEEKARLEIGEEAEIFQIHQIMLDDEGYLNAVKQQIHTEKRNAVCAVELVSEEFEAIFRAMDDEYMQARSMDVRDISKRIIHLLQGESVRHYVWDRPMIVFAEDLEPSETMLFDRKYLAGFVTRHGATTSHASILARMMDIPVIVKADIRLAEEDQGSPVILDGGTGEIYLYPSAQICEQMQHKKDAQEEKKALLWQYKGKESVTGSGRKLPLYANISTQNDMEAVLGNDAEGIGLFRSEFLYLGREGCPSEKEQFEVYSNVIKQMGSKKVIIRTVDIGADKQVPYFHREKEENPAMGYRGIRMCLEKEEIFLPQLKAIYRAAVYGNVAVMFPMITSLEEVIRAKAMLERAKQSLIQEGIPWGEIAVGIMIETPAAAMISDLLAEQVDFFSIGTNDLTQYTLAVDRQNEALEHWYQPQHEAVFRLLRMVAEAAHKRKIPVGICGELAAEESMTEFFVEIGIDELSVPPSEILSLRKRISEVN